MLHTLMEKIPCNPRIQTHAMSSLFHNQLSMPTQADSYLITILVQWIFSVTN